MEKYTVRLAWGCAILLGIPVAYIMIELILDTFL